MSKHRNRVKRKGATPRMPHKWVCVGVVAEPGRSRWCVACGALMFKPDGKAPTIRHPKGGSCQDR